MAKFLTPARVSTLILLDIYYGAAFWTYSPTVCSTILQIVAEQCLNDRDETSNEHTERRTEPVKSILDFGARLSTLETDIPGRSWLDSLLVQLWTCSSVDDLRGIFDRCSLLLISPNGMDTSEGQPQSAASVTRASPVGQFIRRCSVEFAKLQFAGIMTLWTALTLFREPSRTVWLQHRPGAANLDSAVPGRDKSLSLQNTTTIDAAFVATDRVELLLNSSVSRLQKLGHRVPREVTAKLKQWLAFQQDTNLQSLQHFMTFFDAWKSGQYNLALESLHRFFDYSIARGGGDEVKQHYQYALLHLSVLHADFEHWDESVSSMKECITTARENQDAACLNFASSWLMYLRQSRQSNHNSGLQSLAIVAGDGGNGQDELAFLKARASDSKHWMLLSSTLLEEAKYEMRHHGVSSRAVESVLQSSYLNNQHACYSIMPSTAVFQAALYDRLGQYELVQQLQNANLAIHTDSSSLSDQCRVQCRLAWAAVQQGAYKRSRAMLEKLHQDVNGNLKLEQRVKAFASVVALQQAIRRTDMHAATYHMTNLQPVRGYSDLDIVGLIDRLELALLTKQDRLDVALDKVNKLIEQSRSETNGDIAETLRWLVEKARLFAAAGRPAKGFSIVLRVVTTAERCHLYSILIEALAALGKILNELREFQMVSKLAEATLPVALEGADVSLVAELFVTNGEAHIGLISQDATPQSKKVQLARTALSYIERGRHTYAKLQDHDNQLECLLMRSTVSRWLGDVTTAKQADAMHSQLVSARHDRRSL